MFARLVSLIFKDRTGYVGRRFVAACAVTVLATSLLLLHVPYNYFVSSNTIEPLLSDDAFQVILVAIWGTFFAADSANKWAYNTRNDGDQCGNANGGLGEASDCCGRENQPTTDDVG